VFERVPVDKVLRHRAILHRDFHSRLRQKVLGYSLGSVVRFPAFLRLEAILEVSDRSGFEAALWVEPPVKASAGEWLHAGEELETRWLGAAVLAALRPAVSVCCLECRRRFRCRGASHSAEEGTR
jgi:hypothetical protein